MLIRVSGTRFATFLRSQFKAISFGILVGIIVVITYQAFASDHKNVVNSLPPYYFSDSVPGLIGGSGVWVQKGEKLANKYNAVEISCFNAYGDTSLESIRRAGVDPEFYCHVAQADVLSGYLASSLSLFTITEWSAERVVAESDGGCRKVTMVLDRASKTITQTGLLTNSEGLCGVLSPEPQQIYLTNGLDVILGKD